MIIFTNGCFDLLHAGHVAFLQHARACGDILVVGVDNDERVRELKGPGRPVQPLDQRLHVLNELRSVTSALPFHSLHALEYFLTNLKPSLIVKGPDYIGREQDIFGAHLGFPTRALACDGFQHLSTTRIIEWLRQAAPAASAGSPPSLPARGIAP